MAIKKGASATESAIEIQSIDKRAMQVMVLGTTPLYMNAMTAKAKRDLILPPQKNRAARAATLKHDPVEEYRNSMHRDHSPDGPTRLALPAPAFKAAMATAALDVPGSATKSGIGRLVRIAGYSVPVWGVPALKMDGVRQAGMNRTPDIRTRALLREWAAVLEVQFVSPNLTEKAVLNLLAAAGVLVGVGDFRQEKGKGDFGLFEVVGADDERFQRIVAEQGREAQDAAIANPVAYDPDTEELWAWFEAELAARGKKRPAWAEVADVAGAAVGG